MKCPYCEREIANNIIYCEYCGVNIKEYIQANEIIQRAIELEKEHEYGKAFEEIKKATILNVPQDKINEHFHRISNKVQKIVSNLEKGAELLLEKKWKEALEVYEEILRINPKLEEEIRPKIIKAKKEIMRKRRNKYTIGSIIIVILCIASFIAWKITHSLEANAIRTLKQGAISKNIIEKQCAIEALGRLKDRRFLPLIKDALRDTSAMIRITAIKAIEEMKDTGSIPIIKELLHDKNWQVRYEAAKVLSILGDTSGLYLLRKALEFK